jgi:hypothetical protein
LRQISKSHLILSLSHKKCLNLYPNFDNVETVWWEGGNTCIYTISSVGFRFPLSWWDSIKEGVDMGGIQEEVPDAHVPESVVELKKR